MYACACLYAYACTCVKTGVWLAAIQQSLMSKSLISQQKNQSFSQPDDWFLTGPVHHIDLLTPSINIW